MDVDLPDLCRRAQMEGTYGSHDRAASFGADVICVNLQTNATITRFNAHILAATKTQGSGECIWCIAT
ncbi:hypothetical protein GCM10022394_11870 [Zobellella aerophila]|uniref:Uncharacterized protein n=1 Tax=Zobellella aerophila TaxID=870480 RepID=A0ABP6VJ67_9GAMM